MSYKAYPFFRDILINDVFISPLKIKTSTLNYKSEAYVGVWTERKCGRIILTSRDIPFDKL